MDCSDENGILETRWFVDSVRSTTAKSISLRISPSVVKKGLSGVLGYIGESGELRVRESDRSTFQLTKKLKRLKERHFQKHDLKTPYENNGKDELVLELYPSQAERSYCMIADTLVRDQVMGAMSILRWKRSDVYVGKM